jgi:hypothetical protein
MSEAASWASGDSNIARHNEVEILDIIGPSDNGEARS